MDGLQPLQPHSLQTEEVGNRPSREKSSMMSIGLLRCFDSKQVTFQARTKVGLA
jgi:hypothetical protein